MKQELPKWIVTGVGATLVTLAGWMVYRTGVIVNTLVSKPEPPGAAVLTLLFAYMLFEAGLMILISRCRD